jgi:hypothetical protein
MAEKLSHEEELGRDPEGSSESMTMRIIPKMVIFEFPNFAS